MKNPLIFRWLFIEAQTGHGWSNTHFPFIKNILIPYVEDENDIDLEEYIINALKLPGGTAGTTGILIYLSMIPKDALEENLKFKNLKTRYVLEYIWCYHPSFFGNIFNRIDEQRNVGKTFSKRLEYYCVGLFTSAKPYLFIKEGSQ